MYEYLSIHDIVLFSQPSLEGNILLMPDGSLGLIDYGQTKTLSNKQRLRIARIVLSLGRKSSQGEIADGMRELGFQTKFNKDDTLSKYAALFFDSDVAAKAEGCSTPQLYFAKLTSEDPLVHVPDVASKFLMKSDYFSPLVQNLESLSDWCIFFLPSANWKVFVARASFILRGMGTILDKQVCTASRWVSQAEEALREQAGDNVLP